MAFVLDVNLRVKEILGLQKIEATLAKMKGTLQAGIVGGAAGAGAAGGAGGMATVAKAQAAAMAANTVAITKTTVAMNKLSTATRKGRTHMDKTSASTKKAAKSADTFGKSVAIAGKRYGAFLAATIIPFAALGGIGKATALVIDFDSAMLKMRQIMGQTEEQIGSTRNAILNLATATGTSASEIGRVGKVLAQAGFRGDRLTESLTALSKVPLTPSFETIDAALEGTIAAMNQFNKEALTTTEILDVITAVSNKYAASAEDIAKGTARGGAAFEAIGGTFREFVSVFATVRQSTRESAETVGTFMKTISSRLADPKIVNFLSGKGINISEAIEAGNPVAALKQIGKAMEDITSVQERMEINIRLGGRRQVSRLLALNSNLDTLNSALTTAGDSAGAFGKIAEEGLKGLQAQLNIMGQEFNKLIQTLAEPMFVPIIRGVTTVGKAFVSVLDVISPIIPPLVTIVGFAVGFKLLALSIGAATKALTYMSTVSIGGGIPGLMAAVTGGAAGGTAGVTARERIQRRLAGGVGAVGAGGAAVAGGVAGQAVGGAKALATSKIGQLGIAAGLIFAADKLSEHFTKTGEASATLAADFAQAALIVLAGASLLSGKSVTGAISSFIGVMTPWGAAIAAAIAALGLFAYAAKKSVDFDVKNIIDAVTKKISETKVQTIEAGDRDTLQQTVGDLGKNVIDGIQESADRFDSGFSGIMFSFLDRVGNLFSGEGLVTISDSDAQEIIKTMIGDNPKLLNEIMRSAIEQLGAAKLESGLDRLLAESFGGNLKAATRVRQAMIAQVGGLEKITQSIKQIQIEAEVNKLANSITKAQQDFETLHIPVQLSSELGLLSDAVGNAARAIETNVTTFDRLSQVVGRDVGISKPETEFTQEAIEKIVKTGDIGELIDIDQFKELEGFTTDMAKVGLALENFMKSIIKSKAEADSLASLISDPQVNPFDILSSYIDKFIAEYPDKIPPEAETAFRAAAAGLGQQLRNMLTDQGGVLPDTEEVQKAFESVLGKQQPFYEAAISTFKTWMEAQAKQINLALSAEELLANIDIGTSELNDTIVNSLRNAFELSNINFDLPPGLTMGLGDANDVMIELAQNGDVVGQVLKQYEKSYNRHAELNRKVAEAQQTGEGASKGLFEAAKNAAIEVLNLQVALTQLSNIAQKAPQVFSEQQTKRPQLQGEAANRFAEHLDKSSKKIVEFIDRQRQFIEAQAAIDVSQAFEKPANIFAQALTDSANAVKAFTSALTTQDLQKGLGVLQTKVTPEGRVYQERRPIPEAQGTKQQKVVETKNLQSALFGGDIGNVMEALLQAATQMAKSQAGSQLRRGQYAEGAASQDLAKSLSDFGGFIYDIPKMIRDSGLDSSEVARSAAEILKEQAQAPGAKEVEHIGALNRTIGDLTTSLTTLIERPEVARKPGELTSQLTPTIQELLQNLTPIVNRVPETDIIPRVFEDVSSQMQSIVDMQREVVSRQQGIATDGGGTQETTLIATEAIGALGEKIDAVGKAIESQTKQIESSTDKQEEAFKVDGLEQNTEAINENNEVSSKTQEGISGLGERMDKVAIAMEEGIGIDVETSSKIDVNVQGMSEAAQDLKPEFEALARKAAKEEIRIVLQQLARASGNSEAASTFESAIT